MAREFYMNDKAPIVETVKGKLRGFHYDGVDHFYGIRYAKAKRFQMPEPVQAWEGVKDAGSYGMICPVLSEPMPTGEVMTPHRFWPSVRALPVPERLDDELRSCGEEAGHVLDPRRRIFCRFLHRAGLL